jgi:hypothetical protein
MAVKWPDGEGWEWCECDWGPGSGTDCDQPCGCGTGHAARLYRDSVVHWRGGHWRVECAFAVAATDIKTLQQQKRALEDECLRLRPGKDSTPPIT